MAAQNQGPGRRWGWQSEPRPVVWREVRDQLGLRIGWVRFWLRAVTLGVGIWLTGASLLMWQPLQWAVPPFFYGGLILMPAGGLLALLAWITPYPREVLRPCPRCGHSDRVLVLPFRTAHTCRHCRRKGYLYHGDLRIDG